MRATLLAVFALLVAVAVAAAVALVAVTSAMSHGTAEMGVAGTRMRSSLRTKAALLWFTRESDEAASDPTPETLAGQVTARAELLADVQETRRLATPSRTAQLDSLVQRTRDYVALREQLQNQKLSVAEILQRARPTLDGIFTDIQHLVDADDAWAQSVEGSAQRLDATADAVGIATAALLLAGFAVTFVATERLLQRPVIALDAAMTRFGRGDTSVRAKLEGAREIREIATTFNDVADRLDRQEQERMELLGAIAHDLRNPLTPMKLALMRFRRGSGEIASAEAVERLAAVFDKQVARLDAMVGDLLDAARAETGHIELQARDVDLHTLVDDVVALYGPTSSKHRIEVQAPEEPVVVHADPLRIEQVLGNLVSNAIKYSPSGGLVTLRLEKCDGRVGVEVCDEGIGVPAEERDSIFEPFHRSGRSREVAAGVGLGLSVSRKIAQAHGGALELVRIEQGTTFRLTLPAAK